MSQAEAYKSAGTNWERDPDGRSTTRLWSSLMEGCGSCHFARENVDNVNRWRTQNVECLRFPPAMVVKNGQPTQARPRTHVADWCGEYRRAGNPE